jgi:hypothetical protein
MKSLKRTTHRPPSPLFHPYRHDGQLQQAQNGRRGKGRRYQHVLRRYQEGHGERQRLHGKDRQICCQKQRHPPASCRRASGGLASALARHAPCMFLQLLIMRATGVSKSSLESFHYRSVLARTVEEVRRQGERAYERDEGFILIFIFIFLFWPSLPRSLTHLYHDEFRLVRYFCDMDSAT